MAVWAIYKYMMMMMTMIIAGASQIESIIFPI